MLTHQDCPNCGHKECMTIFDDGGTHCHSECGYTPPPSVKHEATDVVREDYSDYRGNSAKTAKFYNVKTGYDKTNKEVRRDYPYPKGGKYRWLPKSFSAYGGFKSDSLFGMDKFNAGSSRTITITEGEEDCLSAYQMLHAKYPVVSLPTAGVSKALLTNCHSYLDAFDQIVLCLDNDEAGETAARRIIAAFPGKVYRVSMTKHKDANAYLQAYDDKDFMFAWNNRKKYVPENILNTSDQFIDLYKNAPEYKYVETGISHLDDKMLGIMQGHFTVIKAETGIGKTEVSRYLEYTLLEKGVPFASWHLEETRLRSLLGLVSYKLKDNLTRQDIIEEKGRDGDVLGAIEALTESENYYQFYLTDDQGADDLLDQIRYLVVVHGVKYVFFEPIQDVVAGQTEASKEEILANLATRLSKLAAELNVGIITIAHTNENNEIKYCKMIGQRASVVLTLDRDLDSLDPLTKDVTNIWINKNRPTAEVGFGGSVKFDHDSFTISEHIP